MRLLPATSDSGRDRQRVMDRDLASEKTPATIKELQARVAAAFGRHPLPRSAFRHCQHAEDP
jgi:hypothetical protein